MGHTSSSALYVVDLVKFRETAAGDNLRVFYETLSKDPNSLSNLDQASHHFHDYSVSSSTLSSFNNNSILFYIDSIMKHLSLSTVQNRKKGQTHITLWEPSGLPKKMLSTKYEKSHPLTLLDHGYIETETSKVSDWDWRKFQFFADFSLPKREVINSLWSLFQSQSSSKMTFFWILKPILYIQDNEPVWNAMEAKHDSFQLRYR